MAKKRIIVPILALILVLLMSVGMLVACNDDPQSVEYTVTFTQGDGTSSTVTVKEGTALTAEQIPEYVIAPGSHVAFDGWFADETEIKAGYVVSANVTATARTTNLYTVTFKNGDEVVKEVEVRAGAQLAADDMPEALQPAVGFAFDGWYVDQTKIDANYAVSADVIAQPKFVDAMAGTYSDGMYSIVIDGAGNITLVDYKQDEFAGTYTIVDGSIVADFENDNLDTSYAIIEGGKVITEEYYGDVVEYVKEGATFDSHVQDFVGVWKYMDTTYGDPVETFIDISLDGENIVILVNGEDMPYTAANYNGTKVSWYYGSNVLAFDNGVLKLNGEFECTKVDTATFKFTVSFELENGTVVASQQVAYGQALNADELPSDADIVAPFGFAFDGWYNENNDILDEEALVYANATYVAQFVQEKIIVKFMNGDQEVAKVAVDFGGKLQASDIPSAVSGEGVFLGYYDANGVKAAADVTPSGSYVDDVYIAVYNATFVSQADYTGAFVNEEEKISVVFNGQNVIIADGVRDEAWTFNEETGEASYAEDTYYRPESYKMLLVGDTLTLTHGTWDMDGEPMTNTYVLHKSTGISGTYYKSNNEKLVVVDGVITNIDSYIYYGTISVDGSSATLNVKRYDTSTELTISAEVDEAGNIIVASCDDYTTAVGVWVKTDTGATRYEGYNDTAEAWQYVYVFEQANVIVFKDGTNYYKATADVAIADGAIVTLTYNENQTILVKIDGVDLVFPGAERGSYTGDEGALYLDGFGAGTLVDATIAYTMSGKGYALIGEKAYVLAESAYTVLADKDGYQGVYAQNGSTYYGYTIDGFGGVMYRSYSSEYPGSYTINDAKTEITIVVEYSSTYGGTFAILEDGNVLDKTGVSTPKTFIKEDYVFTDYLNDMVGYYENADKTGSLEIVSGGTKVYVKIDANVVIATSNYNHSVLTMTIDSIPHTIAKEGDGIKVSATIEGTLNEMSMSKAVKEVSVDTTSLLGKWELATSSNYRTFEFLDSGKVSVYTLSEYSESTKEVDYKLEGNVVTFALGTYDKYSGTLGNGVLALSSVSYNGGLSPVGDAIKIADPVVQGGGDEPVSIIGTWTNGTNTIEITESSCKLDGVFADNWVDQGNNKWYGYFEDCYNVYFELKADGTLVVTGDEAVGTYTKQGAEEQLDAFAGTWTGKVGPNNYTVVCDGKGKININGTDYTYTPGSETISVGVFTVKMNGEKMNVVYDDGEYNYTGDLTK